MTKIFLAGTHSHSYVLKEKPPFILESYYYLKGKHTGDFFDYIKSKDCKMFLLDSGAFTYLNSGKKVDFDEYLTHYINFINQFDIEYFFELDIDKIVGYKKVLEMRKRLEKETGKKSIPVWHRSRGKDEFIKLVKEYDYIAIGGIAIKDIKKTEYKYFHWFLEEAHKNNCKVHGLGFTNLKQLEDFSFDTVDSTTWVTGGQFGVLFHFDGKTLKRINKKKNQKLTLHYKDINLHNIKQWIRYIKKVYKGK